MSGVLSISDDDWAKLVALSEFLDEDPSDVLTAAIDAAYQAHIGAQDTVTEVEPAIQTVLDPNISIAEVVVDFKKPAESPSSRLPFTMLIAISKEDPVLLGSKGDPTRELACEIVYDRIGTVDWGTEETQRLVDQTAKLIDNAPKPT